MYKQLFQKIDLTCARIVWQYFFPFYLVLNKADYAHYASFYIESLKEFDKLHFEQNRFSVEGHINSLILL